MSHGVQDAEVFLERQLQKGQTRKKSSPQWSPDPALTERPKTGWDRLPSPPLTEECLRSHIYCDLGVPLGLMLTTLSAVGCRPGAAEGGHGGQPGQHQGLPD